MNKYLLEIGTEELAYNFIPSAQEQLKNEFTRILEENKIVFGDIKTYATPRRLAIIIEGLPDKQDDVQKIVKGPVASIAYDKDGNLTKAGIGFANKNGVVPDFLYVKDNYIHAKIEQKGEYVKEILKRVVPGIILNLKGTHFMRWADFDIKFQRPIRWLVSLFNDENVEIEIADVKSSNVSRGHRFSKTEVVIDNPDSYLKALEDAHVIADVQKRKQKIIDTATQKANELGAKIVMDEALLEEVTYITEWPVPVVCSFEQKYLLIPEKVSVTVMAVHQRYFPLYKDDSLMNKFITISNYVGNEFDNIRAGNERVVKARLEDAVFFVNEDLQKPLINYVEDLKGMTFQKGFGTLYDKTQRIITLSKKIALELGGPVYSVERTALLCKADLVTKLVFEFTELQGYIGSAYARRNGETQEVSDGIKEHYFPLNADSELAHGIEGQIVGIADKTDTVTAVFASGAKISGSQDPLGVRRAVFGILKTVLGKQLNINLSELIDDSVNLLPVEIENKDLLVQNVKNFFVQRLFVLLADKYSYDVMNACAKNKDILVDLKDFIVRLDIVSETVKKQNFDKFSEGINRIIRIIKNEKNSVFVDETLLKIPEEITLWNKTKVINETVLKYEDLETKLFELIPFIFEFFEKVLVMDNDEKVKQNRLNLLNSIKNKFDVLADFSEIVFQ